MKKKMEEIFVREILNGRLTGKGKRKEKINKETFFREQETS